MFKFLVLSSSLTIYMLESSIFFSSPEVSPEIKNLAFSTA